MQAHKRPCFQVQRQSEDDTRHLEPANLDKGDEAPVDRGRTADGPDQNHTQDANPQEAQAIHRGLCSRTSSSCEAADGGAAVQGETAPRSHRSAISNYQATTDHGVARDVSTLFNNARTAAASFYAAALILLQPERTL